MRVVGGTCLTAWHNGYRYDIVLLRKNFDDVTLWAHESVHVAQGMLEFIGIPLHVGENNEVYAYTVEWCMACIRNFINERNKDENENAQG